jgi:hypothetical protein
MHHACRITVNFHEFFHFTEIILEIFKFFREIFAKTEVFAKRNFVKFCLSKLILSSYYYTKVTCHILLISTLVYPSPLPPNCGFFLQLSNFFFSFIHFVNVLQVIVFLQIFLRVQFLQWLRIKGQSHEKVGEMSVWGISLGPN